MHDATASNSTPAPSQQTTRLGSSERITPAEVYGAYVKSFTTRVDIEGEASELGLKLSRQSEALQALEARVEEVSAETSDAMDLLMQTDPTSLADLAAFVSVLVAHDGERILDPNRVDFKGRGLCEDEVLISILLRGIVRVHQSQGAAS